MRHLWHVKVRNVETGEEIQRIAAISDRVFGPAGAESEMKTYQLQTGRAKPDLSHWEIVEVRRASE